MHARALVAIVTVIALTLVPLAVTTEPQEPQTFQYIAEALRWQKRFGPDFGREFAGMPADWDEWATLVPTPSPEPPPKPVRVIGQPRSVASPTGPSGGQSGQITGAGPDLVRALWPGSNKEEAVSVVRCESNFNPRAISRTNDWGLFQINRPTWERTVTRMGWSWQQMLDPGPNTEFAWWLYQRSGWRPWVCARRVGLA